MFFVILLHYSDGPTMARAIEPDISLSTEVTLSLKHLGSQYNWPRSILQPGTISYSTTPHYLYLGRLPPRHQRWSVRCPSSRSVLRWQFRVNIFTRIALPLAYGCPVYLQFSRRGSALDPLLLFALAHHSPKLSMTLPLSLLPTNPSRPSYTATRGLTPLAP